VILFILTNFYLTVFIVNFSLPVIFIEIKWQELLYLFTFYMRVKIIYFI